MSAVLTGEAHPSFRHGHALRSKKTRTYRIWKAMRMRVFGRIDPQNYADRNITLDARWNDYVQFLADMGEAPDGMSLDRINNDGPYSPENCRWATAAEQARNHRRNRWVIYCGERLTIKDAAKRIGVTSPAISNRVARTGCSFQEAFDALERKAIKIHRAENGRFA